MTPTSAQQSTWDSPAPNPAASTSRSHALVIGGSMAGLLAARVLTDYFDRVTIVERDSFPTQPDGRAGVPQARHVHVLLMAGQRLLDQQFPGLLDELTCLGVPSIDMIANLAIMGMGGWNLRYHSSLIARTPSRDLLEWAVRRRLSQKLSGGCGSVTFLTERQVTGLLTSSGGEVCGVRFRQRGHHHDADAPAGTSDEELYAELVVDASGRTSRAPEWLTALGYETPAEIVINSFLGYATRWYRRPPQNGRDWKALLVTARAPDHKRGGVIWPVEQDRWIVTLTGTAHDYPPTQEAAFLEFARSLRTPLLYEAIKDAEPLSPIYGYQRTENKQRHYEKLTRWPTGFLVLGDAVCAFNPVYGQGMTCAAQAAEALDSCLRSVPVQQGKRDLAGLGLRFQRSLARVTATPWLMATGEDFRWPTTEGGQPDVPTRLMHKYLDGVLTMCAYDREAMRGFMEVTHLVEPPTDLFRPPIMMAVLRWALNRKRLAERRALPLIVP